MTAPREYGEPLRKTLKNYRKLRAGDYRVVSRAEERMKSLKCMADDCAQALTEQDLSLENRPKPELKRPGNRFLDCSREKKISPK
ncbi:MAG: type II toxin-antitoxin system RelE family toxin [Desulfobacterales bacterium]